MATAFAASTQAHPGHALGDHGALHAVTSLDHLVVLGLCGAALWFGARLVQRRVPRQILQGAGVAAVVTAAVLLGVRA